MIINHKDFYHIIRAGKKFIFFWALPLLSKMAPMVEGLLIRHTVALAVLSVPHPAGLCYDVELNMEEAHTFLWKSTSKIVKNCLPLVLP